MPDVLNGLVPKAVWDHFGQISAVPRPSKKEEKIAAHIVSIVEKNNLPLERDATGNILVRKPASAGKEASPMVALQSHIDMVCEKNKGVVHDFDRDGIQLVRSNGFIKAQGTTLGSDNGIGVAAALSVMLDKTLVHGPMEFLFTVDEETGLTGANGLQTGFLKSKILLNLDSEEEGALYVGCSGGRDTMLRLTIERESAPQGFIPLTLGIGGLRGGHSGLDINTGRGNAIKLLARALWQIAKSSDIRISHIGGGSKRNAIPREAEAVVYVHGEKVKAFRDNVDSLKGMFRNEYATTEPQLTFDVPQQKPETNGQVFRKADQEKLLNLLYALPHGVIAMSPDIPGLVETSTNVATIETETSAVIVGTSQRSSVNTVLDDLVTRVGVIGKLAGCAVEHTDGYPGWKPNLASTALNVTKKTYKQLYGKEPAVKAIHAGLECGIIGEKFPGMDMVSFGPTIEGAHSPDERVDIASVQKFWDLLAGVLKNLA